MEPSGNLFSADLVHLDVDAVVVLLGELDLESAPQLAQILDTLVRHGSPEIVVEYSGLSFMDTSGIAVLVEAQSRLGQQDRRLIVRRPQPNVLRVLEITGLVEFLIVDVGGVQHDSTHLAI